MSSKYNIEDVAAMAEVSRGTVSRVLNDHPAVSEATRQRVMAVIAELNYRPNFSARHMRTQTSNLVGFVTDEVTTTPFAVDMIRGAQEALWAIGKILLVVNSGYGLDLTTKAFEVLLERRVEGVIFAAMFHRGIDIDLHMDDLPVVFANCYAINRAYPSVTPDEFSGGYAAAQVLLEKGHRRIGFINLGEAEVNGMAPIEAATGRLAGFKKALTDYGIPFDEALLRYTHQFPRHTHLLTLELMQNPDPPTALFCGNDRAAMACYGALSELGLRVPQDVAVVGFDNYLSIAEGLWPALTTVQLPHYEMGKWAVEYLLSHKENSPQPVQHKIACDLVQRASV